MTAKQLANLPLGSRVRLEGPGGEEGVIIKIGPVVYISWPDSDVVNYVDTNSPKWRTFISWLEIA
jgi:hypothetical protein